jgi:hypothetical protein
LLGSLRRYIRQHHLALIALFVALGGTAYATATIGPRDIKRNAVRSRHIKNGQVRTGDVADDSLTGKDVNESSLSGIGAGVVMARIQDAAAGGTALRYGAPSGISASSGNEGAVEMSLTQGHFKATDIRVHLEAGQVEPNDSAQTFTLRAGEADTGLSCTIGLGGVGNIGCNQAPGTVVDLPGGGAPLSIQIHNQGTPVQTADVMVTFRILGPVP